MGRKAAFCLLIALFAMAMVLPVAAQESAVKGNIGGTVVDSTGAVVPGAKVTITGPTGTQTQQSSGEGNFLFKNLVPGLYSVKVEKENFKTAENKSVEVVINRTASLRMTIQPGTATEVVEVTTSSVAIDTTSTAVGSNLTDQFYNSVPIPRGVAGLFYAAPGVASGGGTGVSNPSISGGSGLENLYVADGVNITDPAFGGLGVFTRLQGSVGTGINNSFIKEVQVKTGGFEPQYGQSTGGIVQIVTKSGGSAFHGGLSGYAAPRELQTAYKQRDDIRFNNIGRTKGLSQYDLTGELGGYVPGFKNNLFFFGSVNPSWTRTYVQPPQFSTDSTTTQVGLYTLFGGKELALKKNTYNYDGKLTFKLNDRHQIEGSVFGDPSHTGMGPNTTSLVQANNTGFSKWEYGTRNVVARYNGTLSNTWLVNFAYTHNNNDFTETPLFDVFQVTDRTNSASAVPLQGFGFLENHRASANSYTIDTSKVVHAWGEHTFMLGYNVQMPDYTNIKSRSGGYYTVPATNATGGQPDGFDCDPAALDCPVGKQANAQFNLVKASASCTLCPLYTNPTTGVTSPVLIRVTRGEFGPGKTPTSGNYKAAYINDSWNINRHLNVNAGLRWEQYHMAGSLIKYTFTDNWAPRIGVSYDPFGDRKTKIYGNFGRYNYQTPLDAAIRSLSGEDDLLNMEFAPVVNGPGSVTPVLDAAHLLNGATGGTTRTPLISAQVSTADATGFAKGTKLQYQDEWVGGIEREIKGGMVLSARYIDRRLKRNLEDVAGVSPENYNFFGNQFYFIANPNSQADFFHNENSVVFPSGSTPPAGCTDPTLVFDPVTDANGNDISASTGNAVCFNQVGTDPVTGDPLFGGEPGSDGIPDGFPNPVRKYQAFELELNKGFSQGWQMRLNWRVARNFGNYEGAFRNDNGQTDPNISSLFDFTQGKLNLLGDQFKAGPLPTDRRHIINAFFSYTVQNGWMKNLTLGTGMRVQSGTPLSTFVQHPGYGNAGEVPLGGRGALGRTPYSGTADVHMDYPFALTERQRLRFGVDVFNITNTKTALTIDQNRDLSFAALNSNIDFRRALSYQSPLYARFGVRWEF